MMIDLTNKPTMAKLTEQMLSLAKMTPAELDEFEKTIMVSTKRALMSTAVDITNSMLKKSTTMAHIQFNVLRLSLVKSTSPKEVFLLIDKTIELIQYVANRVEDKSMLEKLEILTKENKQDE